MRSEKQDPTRTATGWRISAGAEPMPAPYPKPVALRTLDVLNKLFNKILTLDIGGQPIAFHSLAEFEFALSGRTDVPTKKLAELMVLSPDDLKREAKAISDVEHKFVEIMSEAITEPGRLGPLLRKIDIHVFSQDHHWRDVIRALNEKDGDYDELRRIAVIKYMQYLRSRQDVIKQAYKLKKRAKDDAADKAAASDKPAAHGDTMIFELPPELPEAPPGEVKAPAAMRETVIFDSVIIDQNSQSSEFTRLMKGEATSIRMKVGDVVDVKLSKHAFKLSHPKPRHFELIDDAGRSHELIAGKNIVGRDAICNVLIDNAYRDVSRLHLVIEPLEYGELVFTDLSSHGTYVPSDMVSSGS